MTGLLAWVVLVFLSNHEAVHIEMIELDLAPGAHFRVRNVSLLVDELKRAAVAEGASEAGEARRCWAEICYAWNNVTGRILEFDRAMAGR